MEENTIKERDKRRFIKEEKSDVYDLVVRCEIDGEEKNFYFDYVEDNTTTISSDLCTHPLVGGDSFSDHMYVKPILVSFSGTFSLFGNKKADKEYDFGTTDRLSNIQEMFERIMKEGIKCTLIKMNSNKDQSRFKVRNNMVLTNITWIEHQSSIDFEFTFNEVLTSAVQLIDYYEEYASDELPITSDPYSLNVTEELIDENDIMNIIISTLQENGMFEDGFLEDAITFSYLLAVSERVIWSTVISAGVAIVMCYVNPIVLGAAILISAVAYTVIKYNEEKNYRIKPFKYYTNEKKREKERNRFYEFIGQIKLEISKICEGISIKGFSQNVPQECFVTIDNNNYIFTFTKSTKNSFYSLKITDIDGKNILSVSDISQKAISNIGECSLDTKLFSTSSGSQVYLLNRELYTKLQDVKILPKEVTKIQKDLSKYAIVSSTVDLIEFKRIIEDIIKVYIFKEVV